MSLGQKKILDAKDASVYDVIKAPLVTEKSTACVAENRYAFSVDPRATKADIRTAVETLFKVEVESVSTLNQVGKVKRFKGRLGQRPGMRKAFVRLKKGQTIDTGAGVK